MLFFTEISGFGLTFRRGLNEAGANARRSLRQLGKLQKVRKDVAETQADFAEANEQTEDRLTGLESAIREIKAHLGRFGAEDHGRGDERGGPSEPVAGAKPAEPSPPSTQPSGISSTTDDGNGAGQAGPIADELSTDKVLGYAAEYNRTRSTMVAGPDRSAKMERIFSGMRSAVKSTHVSRTRVEHALTDPSDRGIRLTAYAYLIEHPEPELVGKLIIAAKREDKPFGQYCALRAVNRLVKESKTGLTPELSTHLSEIAITAGVGTDRAREVDRILTADEGKPRNTV